MCPNEDRIKVFIKTTDGLKDCMVKDSKTGSELAFWIPKYILMRGKRSSLDIGLMSPQIRRLARIQDKIG